MRWYLENAETGEFLDVRFDDDGGVTKTHGDVGTEGEVTSETFDSRPDAEASMNVKLETLMNEGFDFRTPPDERRATPDVATTYYAEEFESELKRLGATRSGDRNLRQTLQEYHVDPPSPSLEKFLTIRDTHQFGYTNFGEWRIWDADCWAPTYGDGNLFEQLVLMDQSNYLGTAMMEYLTGGVFIGTAGNGDSYFAYTNRQEPNKAEIFFYNHETADLEFAFADDIATFAYANHLYCLVDDEDRFDADTFPDLVSPIEEFVSFSWHYESISDEAEIWPEYGFSNQRPRYQFYRSRWISYLLRADGVHSVSDAGDMFYADYHAPLLFSDALKYPFIKSSPITQLYWLWRLWFFDHTDELSQLLDILRDAPSPIARDAGKLVEEFQRGRKTLGKIEDIHAVREAWLALDLDPARAEERMREEAEKEQRAQAQLAEDLEAAHALIASGADLAVEAWDYLDSPEILDVFEEHLRHDAATRDEWAILDARFEQLEEYTLEYETTAALIAQANRWTPFLLKHGVGLSRLARTRDPKLKPLILAKLTEYDEYFHGVTAASNALALVGASSDAVETLISHLDKFCFDPDDFMQTLTHKDPLRATIRALGESGDPNAAEALMAFDGRLPEVLRPVWYKALGQLEYEPAVSRIIQGIASEHVRPALFSLAILGSNIGLAPIEEYLSTISGDPRERMYELLAVNLLKAKLGQPVDMEILETALDVVESKAFEEHESRDMQMSLLEETGRSDLAWKLFDTPFTDIRERAIARHPNDVTYYDPATLAAGLESDPQFLTKSLKDPNGVFRYAAITFAYGDGENDEWTPEFVEAVAQYLPTMCRYRYYTNSYVQDGVKHIESTLDDLMEMDVPAINSHLWFLHSLHPNPLYKEAPNDPAAAAVTGAALDSLYDAYGLEKPNDGALEWTTSDFANTPWYVGASMSMGSGGVNGMAWAPDGEELVVAATGRLPVFNTEGELVREFDHPAWNYDVDFHPDGSLLAVCAAHARCTIFDFKTGDLVKSLEDLAGGIRKVKFSPSGRFLACVSDYQSLFVFDTSDWSQVLQHNDKADVNTLAWWPDESHIIIATDRAARLVRLEDGSVRETVTTGGVAEIQIDPAGERLYVGAKNIRVFDLELNEFEDAALKHTSVSRMRFSEDGSKLYAASWEGKDCGVWCWDIAKGRRRRLKGHEDSAVFGMDRHPSNGKTYAGGGKNLVCVWDEKNKIVANDAHFHTNEIASFLSLGETLWTVSDDFTLIEWSAEREALRVHASEFRPCMLVASEDGSTLYLSGSKHVQALSYDTLEPQWTTEIGRSEFLYRHGDTLCVASGSRLAWVNAKTGEIEGETDDFADSFLFHSARIDERRIVCSGYDDLRTFVFDLETRANVETIAFPPLPEKGSIHDMWADANAQRLFVARWNGSMLVYDTSTTRLVSTIRTSCQLGPFASDGDTLYAVENRNVVQFDLQTLERSIVAAKPGAPEKMIVAFGGLVVGGKSGSLHIMKRNEDG